MTTAGTAGGTGGRILVVGATGFIGAATVRALVTAAPAVAVRLLLHHRHPAAHGDVERVWADLTDRESLRAACEGVTRVLHLASYVGGDPERCRAVNDAGTANLVEQARRAGMQRLIYLSTTGVYGDAATTTDRHPVPAAISPASRTRLGAERTVLAAGGTVLRPHLVYGAGDRWVVPTVVRLIRRIGGLPGDGHAPQSLIAVDDLGRLLAAFALAANDNSRSAVYHACHPTPVTPYTMATVLARHLAIALPTTPVPEPDAVARLRGSTLSVRHVGRLARPHVYDSEPVWGYGGLEPGADFGTRAAECADWYRRHLAKSD